VEGQQMAMYRVKAKIRQPRAIGIFWDKEFILDNLPLNLSEQEIKDVWFERHSHCGTVDQWEWLHFVEITAVLDTRL